MKLNFSVPLMYVANEYTEWAKLFKKITAKADNIPINTLDKNINCFRVNFSCPSIRICFAFENCFVNILLNDSVEMQS